MVMGTNESDFSAYNKVIRSTSILDSPNDVQFRLRLWYYNVKFLYKYYKRLECRYSISIFDVENIQSHTYILQCPMFILDQAHIRRRICFLGGGKQTDVPGMRGSQTTVGLISLNLSSDHPFFRDISQQLSPGWAQ